MEGRKEEEKSVPEGEISERGIALEDRNDPDQNHNRKERVLPAPGSALTKPRSCTNR